MPSTPRPAHSQLKVSNSPGSGKHLQLHLHCSSVRLWLRQSHQKCSQSSEQNLIILQKKKKNEMGKRDEKYMYYVCSRTCCQTVGLDISQAQLDLAKVQAKLQTDVWSRQQAVQRV